MKKQLITLLLLLTSFLIFSQTTRNEQKNFKISKNALILIKKDLQFCDSLKVAYAFKSKELRNLQEKNINLFSQLQNENSKINLLENQIEKQKNEIQNFKKKRNNTIIYISVGFVSGVITTLLLTK